MRFTHAFILMSLAGMLPLTLAAEPNGSPVSGIYYAEKMAVSPHFKASGIAWWKGRLIISNREPPKLHAFTPPDQFEVFKELTHPVGVAVDPKNRLVFTEKEDKVLYRLARYAADGKEENILKEVDVDNKKPGPMGIGSPHFLAIHPNGAIYWSGFPNGGTRYLLPGSRKVIVASPRIVHTYGIGLSPGHDWLYVNSKIPNADARGTWRFPVDKDGRLGEGKFFIAIDQFTTTHLKDLPAAKDGSDKLLGWVGRLQGLAVDRLGYIYLAGAEAHKSGAAVAVFTPDGKKLAAMIVARPGSDLGIPTNISGLAFGGADGRTLYITGAGTYRLYRVQLPVAGEVFRN
jgi:gluconolactonase